MSDNEKKNSFNALSKKSMDKIAYFALFLICMYYVPTNLIPTFLMKEEKVLSKVLTKDYFDKFQDLQIKSLTSSSFYFGHGCSTRFTVDYAYKDIPKDKNGWIAVCTSPSREDVFDLKIVNDGKKLVAYTMFAPSHMFKDTEDLYLEYKYVFYGQMSPSLQVAERGRQMMINSGRY